MSGRLPISSFHVRPMISRVLSIAAFLTLASPTLAQGPGSSIPATPSAANAVPGPFGFVRCLTPDLDPNQSMFLPPSDCSANSTNPTSAYDAGEPGRARDPGGVPRDPGQQRRRQRAERPRHQPGRDLQRGLRRPRRHAGRAGRGHEGPSFDLATSDPQGQASTGIIRYDNSSWFNDNGSYWNSIAWDPNVYLNVYTLGAPSGSSNVLGYVPYFPQSGNAGSAADRVVLLNGTVGRNAPLAPYNQGRTGTHEVGHYLGLYHTFQSGCGGSNCNTQRRPDLRHERRVEPGVQLLDGRLVELREHGPGPQLHELQHGHVHDELHRGAGAPDALHPRVLPARPWGRPVGPVLGANYCDETPNSTGLPATLVGTGTKQIANNDFGLYAQGLPVGSPGYFICSPNQAQVPGPGGSQGTLCVGGLHRALPEPGGQRRHLRDHPADRGPHGHPPADWQRRRAAGRHLELPVLVPRLDPRLPGLELH